MIDAGVNGKITIKDQYKPQTYAWNGAILSADYGIEEVQFADDSVFQAGEIAAASGRGTVAAEWRRRGKTWPGWDHAAGLPSFQATASALQAA